MNENRDETRERGKGGRGWRRTHSPSVVCKPQSAASRPFPCSLSHRRPSRCTLACHHGRSDHCSALDKLMFIPFDTAGSSTISNRRSPPQPRVVGGGDAHLVGASSQLSNTKRLEHTSCLKYHVASAMPESVEKGFKYNFICYAQGSNSFEGLMKERNPWYSPDVSYHITSSFHRLTRWNDQHCTTLSCLPEEKSSAASTVSELKVRISRKYCNTTHKSP